MTKSEQTSPAAVPTYTFLTSGWLWVLIVALLLGGACLPLVLPSQEKEPFEIVLLQVNDVYEIAGLNGGTIGGLARVATLKKQLLGKNPNTLLVMAGDFISPSVFNSVRDKGSSVGGAQMIESMNSAGFDLVIFGNHEFDLSYATLQKRMNESHFQWLASNVYHLVGSDSLAFQRDSADIPRAWTKIFHDKNGRTVSIGFIGLTIADNKGDLNYAAYRPTLEVARQLYDSLSKKCDAVIAVTHQDEDDDKELAAAIPGLTAILGGHEHDHREADIGEVDIRKAFSNARSAYEWKIVFGKKGERPKVYPSPIPVDKSIAKDPATDAIVDKWMDIGKDYFIKLKFNPDSPVCAGLDTTLDGRDEYIRSGPTNLTRLITDGMLWSTRKKYQTQLALMNAGSVRVDDIITPPITEYSFLRALPYRGATQVANFRGDSLKLILNLGVSLSGTGGYLQSSSNVRLDSTTKTWLIDEAPINDARFYRVAIADYLIRGLQKKMEFIKPYNRVIDMIGKDSVNSDLRFDVVKATIAYYKTVCSRAVPRPAKAP